MEVREMGVSDDGSILRDSPILRVIAIRRVRPVVRDSPILRVIAIKRARTAPLLILLAVREFYSSEPLIEEGRNKVSIIIVDLGSC
jgi:hypothetical protein